MATTQPNERSLWAQITAVRPHPLHPDLKAERRAHTGRTATGKSACHHASLGQQKNPKALGLAEAHAKPPPAGGLSL